MGHGSKEDMGRDQSASSKWKLSRAAVVGLSTWVAIFVVLAAAVLVRKIQEGHDRWIGIALQCSAILVAGLGASSYIYVGARAPRPAQLHRNGLLPLILLPELVAIWLSKTLATEELLNVSAAVAALGFAIRPFIVALFIRLVKQKICSLGPPASRCTNLAHWANLLVAVSFIGAFCGLIPVSIYRAVVPEEMMEVGERGDMARSNATDIMGNGSLSDVPPPRSLLDVPPRPPNVIDTTTALIGDGHDESKDDGWALFVEVGEGIIQGSLLLQGVLYVAVVAVTARHVSTALARLVHRKVTEEQLSKVRRVVLRHVTGMLAGFFADLSFIVFTTIDLQDFFGNQVWWDNLSTASAHLVVVLAYTTGVLLLSGVGVLLLGRDDDNPDAGDVSGKLRGLMHAAVLTSRADTVFEGRVAETSNLRCVASFPGKYVREWNELTWFCEQGDLSCACVFLPGSDPQQRFGRHVDCPETPGKCWCHSIYGCEQLWGCMWFDVWKKNVEAAVSLGLKLVVVYFEGQAGQGQVLWEHLGSVDLWDGRGLGGSQKAEVAYLKKMGLEFLDEDLSAFRCSLRTKKAAAAAAPQAPSPS